MQCAWVLPDASEYPSNAALNAANGIPEIEQAELLIAGEWQTTDDATQCVTTYEFGTNGVFALSSLDQRASGFYQVLELDGNLELVLDFESENFQSSCEGEINDSEALDSGGSFGWFISFIDQNTISFSSIRSGGFEAFRFTRQ